MLLQYAAKQGWDVYRVYSGDDYTRSDRRRPEFNRLLADAQAHRFDIVLCKTQSRQCSCRHVAKDACIGSFISVEGMERSIEIHWNF